MLWHRQILRLRAFFCRKDCTRRSKFLKCMPCWSSWFYKCNIAPRHWVLSWHLYKRAVGQPDILVTIMKSYTLRSQNIDISWNSFRNVFSLMCRLKSSWAISFLFHTQKSIYGLIVYYTTELDSKCYGLRHYIVVHTFNTWNEVQQGNYHQQYGNSGCGVCKGGIQN